MVWGEFYPWHRYMWPLSEQLLLLLHRYCHHYYPTKCGSGVPIQPPPSPVDSSAVTYALVQELLPGISRSHHWPWLAAQASPGKGQWRQSPGLWHGLEVRASPPACLARGGLGC